MTNQTPSSTLVALAVGMLILTPLFWAGHSVVGRLIANDIPTFSLVSLRWLTATVIFGAFVARSVWPQRYLMLKHWRYIVFTGLIGPTMFPIMLYSGLQTTTVTNTSIIQTIVPALVPLIAWLVLRDRVAIVQICGIAVSMFGVSLIISQGDLTKLGDVEFVVGDFFILAGFICWAVYTVTIRLKPADMKPNTLLLGSMMIGGLSTLPLWFWEASIGETIPLTSDAAWAIGYIIIFPTLLAYFFYNQSIAILGPTKAGLASHLVPPLGIILGVVFLNEVLSAYHGISFALVACGVALVIKGGRASKSPKPS